MTNYTVTPQTAAAADALRLLKRFEDSYLTAAHVLYGEADGDAKYYDLSSLLVKVHDQVNELLTDSIGEALDAPEDNVI